MGSEMCIRDRPETQPDRGTPLGMIPEVPQKRTSPRKSAANRTVNKPFVPPIPKERDAWFDIPEARRSQTQARSPRRLSAPKNGPQYEREGELGDNFVPALRLTPPAANTDIRTFLGGRSSNAGVVAIATAAPGSEAEVSPRPHRQTFTRDFISASHLGLETGEQENHNHTDTHTRNHEQTRKSPLSRRPQRTKSGRCALSETTGNAPTMNPPDELDDQEQAPVSASPQAPTRRIQRVKSSQLPLERVPANARMQNVVLTISSSVEELKPTLGAVDTERELLAWDRPAIDVFDALNEGVDRERLGLWSEEIERLLVKLRPEGEVRSDLRAVLGAAVGAMTDEVEECA